MGFGLRGIGGEEMNLHLAILLMCVAAIAGFIIALLVGKAVFYFFLKYLGKSKKEEDQEFFTAYRKWVGL